MKKIFLGPNMYQAKIWCYLKLVRWRDEEWDEQMNKKFFLVWTCIKPNLVLSEISEMKRWRVRWTDEENFFGSELVSSQIWCYLKLVRWRDEEWDEQMKKIFLGPNMYQAKSGVIWISEMKSEMKKWRKIFFLVWTCIKPNLVLSEISEMKRWRVRWTDEENFFWFEHVSSQIWCYLKLVRWRDEEWDEEMKKIFFWSEHVSSQI